MYVLAPNQIVAVYPYSVDALKRDNPTTSFPAQLSDQDLAAWSVYPVTATEPPACDPATQTCTQINPVFNNNAWVMRWEVTQASDQEIAARLQAKELEVRLERNAKLADCDWTQLPDSPVDATPWAVYRQALRDVPSQAGFPWSVQWPSQP